MENSVENVENRVKKIFRRFFSEREKNDLKGQKPNFFYFQQNKKKKRQKTGTKKLAFEKKGKNFLPKGFTGRFPAEEGENGL